MLAAGHRPAFDLRDSEDYKSAKLVLEHTAEHGSPNRVQKISFDLVIEDAAGVSSTHSIGWADYDSFGEPARIDVERYGEPFVNAVFREAAELRGIPVLPLELPPEDQPAV